ncbi:hypothetical protein QUF31_21630 [Dickeya chrysanthemi]|uniref:hypothetical protein n=1 Tax=Dickeya chrysanthemi TaxID=556 RepID=UPI0025A098DF|nr:hypothetical protein [Dickeya chrysanthemi]WJM85538.1 hypothetical protein QUF31_21630 [Dickeya chrysanthemi]
MCQPTVPVLAAVSLMATNDEPTPRSLVMMGGPIDARRSPTQVNNLATENGIEWFQNNLIHTVPLATVESRRDEPLESACTTRFDQAAT